MFFIFYNFLQQELYELGEQFNVITKSIQPAPPFLKFVGWLLRVRCIGIIINSAKIVHCWNRLAPYVVTSASPGLPASSRLPRLSLSHEFTFWRCVFWYAVTVPESFHPIGLPLAMCSAHCHLSCIGIKQIFNHALRLSSLEYEGGIFERNTGF